VESAEINMKIAIKNIIVKNRIRRELGDIEALAESLKQYGQISPVVINGKNILIAGGRRLEAAKLLGWQEINAVIIETSDKLEQLELEVEENKHRKDFNEKETADALRKIKKMKNPNIFRRFFNMVVRFFKKLFRLDNKNDT
jgi:ParB family chromosome partitioning protein